MKKSDDDKTLRAVTLTIVNAACLVWLAHFFFVVACCYGLTLLIPIYPAQALAFYIPPAGWSINLAQLFLIVSILATVAALSGACIYLKGSRAKWRQVFLLTLISMFMISYASMLCWLEDWSYEGTKGQIEFYEKQQDLSMFEKQEFEKLKRNLAPYLNSKKSD